MNGVNQRYSFSEYLDMCYDEFKRGVDDVGINLVDDNVPDMETINNMLELHATYYHWDNENNKSKSTTIYKTNRNNLYLIQRCIYNNVSEEWITKRVLVYTLCIDMYKER